MQAVRRKKNIDIVSLLVIFIIFDMVIGGSGRVIEFGPLSLRILLFALFFLVFLLFYGKKCRISLFALFAFIYVIIELLYSIYVNPIENVVAEIKGYIPLLLCPAFIWFFRKYDLSDFLWKFAVITIRLLAILQIVLWVYAYIYGDTVYDVLTGLLTKYDYGLFDYIDAAHNIPRVFLKTSIFLFVGILAELSRFMDGKIKISGLLFLFIEAIALLTTFTLGFWVASALSIVILLMLKRKRKSVSIEKLVVILFIISLLIILFVRFNVVQMFIYRWESDSVTHKFSQASKLLSLWVRRPIFGYGMGCETSYYVNNELVTRYIFENVWLQLLFHNGVVGLILFVGAIFSTVYKLHLLYKKTHDMRYLILSVSIIYICIVSFFNPFINNSIGLTFFAVCTGVAHSPHQSISSSSKCANKSSVNRHANELKSGRAVAR